MPPSKAPRWNPAATNEVTSLFNLYTSTGGQEGCDPRNQGAAYVIEQLRENDFLRQFLSSSNGGHPSNKNNTKATRGYKRAASEYITFLAKNGIRRKDYPKYLEDEALTGQRSVEEEESSSSGSDVESSSDNESDDASDDETDDDRKLPATSMPPRKLKSPPVKSPPSKVKPISQRKKDPSEDDVGALANALKGIIITQKDGTIGIIDVTQAYDYVVFVAKCERNVNYAHVRLQLPSDITSKMITCKVADDGWSVVVKVRKPIDCALIDPMFILMKYHAEGNVDQNHPIAVSLASLRRSHIESEKEEYTEKIVNVRLPFVCDKSGFYDPASFSGDHEDGISLGIYPISVEKHLDGIPIAEGAPHPNTNFLTFACKELHEEKVIQKVKATSFMNLVEPTTAPAAAPAAAPPIPHVEDL